MTPREKSKIIFEALELGLCWHKTGAYQCGKCGKNLYTVADSQNPNYFDPKLPDDERVKLVTSGNERFGALIVNREIHKLQASEGFLPPAPNEAPAATIAEAIFKLIIGENNGMS